MSKTTFVCTPEVAKVHGQTPNSGLATVTLDFHAEQCKTKFGRWLAERIRTTMHADDLSNVRLLSRQTVAHSMLQEDINSLLVMHPCNSEEDHSVLLDKLAELVTKRRRVAKKVGSMHFHSISTQFSWPVLGSRAANHITDPAEYFDYCAGLIRGMNPSSVKLWNDEWPASKVSRNMDHI